MNRRDFLVKSIQTSAAAASLGFLSVEERGLLASTPAPAAAAREPTIQLPHGKIGELDFSRLIIGGNLIAGFAHSRDLLYVNEIFKNYFTDEKVIETLQLCEEMGVDTAILRTDDNTLRILDRYWNQYGGKIKWIAQTYPREGDLSNVQKAIDHGAQAVFMHGGIADQFVKTGKVDYVGEVVEFIRKNDVPAGVGGHSLAVPKAVEAAGIPADFYMKTLHSPDYWSFNPANQEYGKYHVGSAEANDNVWCVDPDEVISFMEQVEKPWIAYKVLAAGAIKPADGFKYAFENGADFICAGMFDFHVRVDALITKNILNDNLDRKRPWFS
jgi:hypothetical protein